MKITEKFFEDMYTFFNQIMSEGLDPTLAKAKEFFNEQSFEVYVNLKKEAGSASEMIKFMRYRQKSFKSWKFTMKEVILGEDNKAATYHTINIENFDGTKSLSHILNMWEFKDNKITKWFALVYPPVD